MISHKSAFSLIELLVVIVLVSILAIVGVYQYRNAVLKARASKLANVINQARQAGQLWMMAHFPEDKTFYDTGSSGPYGPEVINHIEELAWDIPELTPLEKELHFRLIIFSGTQEQPFFGIQAEPIDETTGFAFYYLELLNGSHFCGGGGKVGEYLSQIFHCKTH